MIFRRVGKTVDTLLGHGEPIGHGDLLADKMFQLFDAAEDLGHVLEAPGECSATAGPPADRC